MTKPATSEPYKLLLFGVAAIAFTTTALIVGVSQKIGRNVLKPRQFTCEKQLEIVMEAEVWTVLFQSNNNQPWLRIVTGVEGDTTPEQRCYQVINTLDAHFSEGLATLKYRKNLATPDRYAVCLQTAKHRKDDCVNLVILKPNIEPQRFFERFTIDLQPALKEARQNQLEQNNGAIASSTEERQPPQGLQEIDLRSFLEIDAPTE